MYLLIIMILVIKKYSINYKNNINNININNLLKISKLNDENYQLINKLLDNYLYTIDIKSNSFKDNINITLFNNLDFINDKSTFKYNVDCYLDLTEMKINKNDLLNYYNIETNNNNFGLLLYLSLFNSLTYEDIDNKISCKDNEEFNLKLKNLLYKNIFNIDNTNNKISTIISLNN